MPNVKVFEWWMITPNFDFKEKYWPLLSDHVFETFGNTKIDEPAIVELILKECFGILGGKFMELIHNQKLASFYVYVHWLHENSLHLWDKQLKAEKLPINETDFALTRRVLKIILEQCCDVELTNAPNYVWEINDNKDEFVSYVEELIYVGYQAIILSDAISISQLFPKSISFEVANKSFAYLYNEPYKTIIDYVQGDHEKHNNEVVGADITNELRDVWINDVGLDFNAMTAFIGEQEHNKYLTQGFYDYDNLIATVVSKLNYPERDVKLFYEGLSINTNNKLSFEDCILRNQDIRRYLYRPIVNVNIEGKVCSLIGIKKWFESIRALTTNAIPFGIWPVEWSKFKAIRNYMEGIRLNHSEILEKAAIKIIEAKNHKYDWNITSLNQKSGNNTNIDNEGEGEVDLIFIDEMLLKIYICECKHNRSKHDFAGMRRDYSNFKSSYEEQLRNKIALGNKYKFQIIEHFEIKYGTKIAKPERYKIEGIFIINAPTVYMYNSHFPTLTLKNLEELLSGTYETKQFRLTDINGSEHLIGVPLFDSVASIDRFTKLGLISPNDD